MSKPRLATLLIVDDEVANMKALCDTLELEGYGTMGFPSPVKALEALRERQFDLVLSDLMMPEMDGVELLRRALEIDPNLVGIMMTGQGTIDTAVRAMQAGALDYILKPCKLSAILPVLSRALAVRRLRLENIQLHEAVGLYKLSMAVAFAFDIVDVLEKVAKAALSQIGEHAAVSILLPDEDGQDLRVAIARGTGAPCIEGSRLPFDASLTKWIEVCRDMLGRTDEFAGLQSLPVVPLPELRGGISLPMVAGRRFVGMIHFNVAKPGSAIAGGQGKMLNILANAAASAIERASLVERLRSAEQRYRRLAENAPDIIFRYEVHPKRRFSYVNPAVERITGYSTEAHYSDPDLCFKVVHRDDLPLMEEVIRGDIADGNAVTLRYVHRDGHEVWTEQRNMAVHDQNGQLIAIEGITRDITSRRQLEEGLRQAQKMEAIGRLAGGVAHDFNNLLTVINGYSDLLLSETGLPSAGRAGIDEIRKAGENAAALTRQLLAFGRRQVIQTKVLDINRIVESNSKMLQRMIGEDIELITRLDPHLGSIKADAGQIEQVLMNLVVNSRDAMPQGGRITIETCNVITKDESGRTVSSIMLTVMDTGCGMDAATQARIFEPFFTTKESGRGTGLGLSIVSGIVQQNNGTIRVSSESGKGTSFTIQLPRVEERQARPETAGAVRQVPKGSESILLVEDDALVRQFIGKVLERAGYRLLVARDGGEAAEILKQQERMPELVISDLVMPGMSGPALMESIKQLSEGVHILYISGYADDTVARHGYLDPGVPFLQKPFTADDLLLKVRQTIDTHPKTIGAGTSLA